MDSISINLITAVINAGKSIADILSKKSLTKSELENIISKHSLGSSNVKEKFFIVLSQNQELCFNEKTGDITIKNKNIDNEMFQYLLLKDLVKEFEVKDSITGFHQVDNLDIGNEQDHVRDDIALIDTIQKKHRRLYGK